MYPKCVQFVPELIDLVFMSTKLFVCRQGQGFATVSNQKELKMECKFLTEMR